MENVLYLAMTAAEFRENGALYPHLAWMACHFSPYGTGLSNLPTQLPKGSILMVNDRTPVFGHDPQLIARQLAEVAAQLECSGILLDLQRPPEPQATAIAEAVSAVDCPVAITPQYAQGLECALFLPSVPLTTSPEAYFSPWKGREIWLEMATEYACIRVTPEGSRQILCEKPPLPYLHTDEHLHCRYCMDVQQEHIDFHLCRDETMLQTLMEESEKLGVRRFVGLYQQLGQSFSQPMAQDTARFQD